MKPVKWGIISTANIGVAKVLPGMLKSKDIEIVAISSRRKKTAEEWAGKLGIPKAYGSYEEMLADPEIEAVYNPLPNHLHVPLTLAAAKAGKHVLCEKPIAITAKEAMQLKKIRNVFVAEAFMVRHAAQWLAVRDLVKKKKIGEVRAIQVLFSYFNRDPKNVRNKSDIGGGGLLDIGCYPITVSRFIFDGEPSRVTGTFDRDPKFGTDRIAGGLADFGAGRHLSFTIPDQPNRYFLQGMEMNEGEWTSLPVSDQYQLQAEAFGRVIRKKQKPFWGVEDAIQNMKIIDAFFRSEKSRKWEKP